MPLPVMDGVSQVHHENKQDQDEFNGVHTSARTALFPASKHPMSPCNDLSPLLRCKPWLGLVQPCKCVSRMSFVRHGKLCLSINYDCCAPFACFCLEYSHCVTSYVSSVSLV